MWIPTAEALSALPGDQAVASHGGPQPFNWSLHVRREMLMNAISVSLNCPRGQYLTEWLRRNGDQYDGWMWETEHQLWRRWPE